MNTESVEFEMAINELNAEDEKINNITGELSVIFKALDFFTDLEYLYNSIIKINESLYDAIEALNDHKFENSFTSGIILSGLLSAYEGFMSNFFEILCEHDDCIGVFIEKIPHKALKKDFFIKESDFNRWKQHNSISHNLIKHLKEKTLNNPTRNASIGRLIFNLSFNDAHTGFSRINERLNLKICKECKKHKECKNKKSNAFVLARNAYIHHNGVSKCLNPHLIKISIKDLQFIADELDKIYGAYYKEINNKCCCLENSKS